MEDFVSVEEAVQSDRDLALEVKSIIYEAITSKKWIQLGESVIGRKLQMSSIMKTAVYQQCSELLPAKEYKGYYQSCHKKYFALRKDRWVKANYNDLYTWYRFTQRSQVTWGNTFPQWSHIKFFQYELYQKLGL